VYGYEVLTATNGADAVQQLRAQRRLDLLVIDAELGGEIDGLATAWLARELNPKIEVIYTARVPHLISERSKVRGAPCVESAVSSLRDCRRDLGLETPAGTRRA